MKADDSRTWARIAPYALMSLACFVIALLLIGLLLQNAERLVTIGLVRNFYYITLLPLGLAVAGFLFGVMKSWARYRGNHLGGALELGGPIVGFALVMIGGFVLPPPASNLALTVFVHGERGVQEVVVRNQGFVLLDLGGERRRQPIADSGQAYFPEIPANFRGRNVHASVELDGWEPVDAQRTYRLEQSPLYIAVRPAAAKIAGRVQDANGQGIAGAVVHVGGITATTNAQGRFEAEIRRPRGGADAMTMEVTAEGHTPWTGTVVPNGNPATVVLQKAG